MFLTTFNKFPCLQWSQVLRKNILFSTKDQFCRHPPTRHFSSVVRTPKDRANKKLLAAFSWKSFGISSVLLCAFAGYGYYLKETKKRKIDLERRRSLGKAAIGGNFDLIDQDGKPCSSADFKGKWVLLYFGFTHCPDICPEEMEKMVKVVDTIQSSPKLPPIVPLFITVDPERDTPAIVKKYIAEFSPKIIGLTGTKEQIEKATKTYRVYFSAGPQDADKDYIVDHTIIMYLIDPDGEFVDYYGQLKTAEQVTNGIILSMEKYANLHKTSLVNKIFG